MFISSPVYSPMAGELQTYSPKKKQSNTGSLGNRMAGNEELNKFLGREKQTGYINYTPGSSLNSSESRNNSSRPSNPSTESQDNSINDMAGYVAPKPETWAAEDPKEYKGFTGGVPGVDSPDLSYGQVITSPSGTKTQYGADGSMKTWGTDEALESALDLKQRREYGKANPRNIDYNTNLPSDFDPNGRDNATHEAWLCSEYGVLCR